MKNSIFEYFAELSKTNLSYTQKSGRYLIQKNQEKKIPKEIISKMNLNKKDELLEIGCGLGNLIIPLSKKVKKATGIDHPTIIQKIVQRKMSRKINLISGNFLKLKIKKKFDKILIYGVVHCLKNKKELNNFLSKSLKLIKKNGIILVGDIPNIDMKKRFLTSATGKKFEKKWQKNKKKELSFNLKEFNNLISFNDKLLTELINRLRMKGYNAYLVPQSKNLPFSNTREDILIKNE